MVHSKHACMPGDSTFGHFSQLMVHSKQHDITIYTHVEQGNLFAHKRKQSIFQCFPASCLQSSSTLQIPLNCIKQPLMNPRDPLPIPPACPHGVDPKTGRPWLAPSCCRLSVDLITELIKTKAGHTAIPVFVDRSSKMGHFAPVRLVGWGLFHLQQQRMEAELLCGWRSDHHVPPGPPHVPPRVPCIPLQGLPHRQGQSPSPYTTTHLAQR